MIPRRVDRLAVHTRLSHIPVWIIEALLDTFEPAALRAAAVAEKKREKAKPSARRAQAEEGSEDD